MNKILLNIQYIKIFQSKILFFLRIIINYSNFEYKTPLIIFFLYILLQHNQNLSCEDF